jgi:hypothetical protein
MSARRSAVAGSAVAENGLAAWGPEFQGSTRPAALMRIGLAAVALIRLGSEMSLFNANNPVGLALGALFFLLAGMALAGLRARLAIGGLGALILFLYALGVTGTGQPGWGHHHVYLLAVACIFLSLTDCGRSYSLDRWFALNDAAPGRAPAEHGRLWGQRLILLQLSALYFWTAVDKTDWAFVSGQRLEQTFTWVYSGRFLEGLLAWPALLALFSVVVVLVEYWLALALLLPRWRRWAIPVGLSLHAAFYLLLPVDTYSVTVMILYLALFDPAVVHRFLDRMQGR